MPKSLDKLNLMSNLNYLQTQIRILEEQRQNLYGLQEVSDHIERRFYSEALRILHSLGIPIDNDVYKKSLQMVRDAFNEFYASVLKPIYERMKEKIILMEDIKI